MKRMNIYLWGIMDVNSLEVYIAFDFANFYVNTNVDCRVFSLSSNAVGDYARRR